MAITLFEAYFCVVVDGMVITLFLNTFYIALANWMSGCYFSKLIDFFICMSVTKNLKLSATIYAGSF